MEAQEIINELKKEYCGACKVGTCLSALTKLTEATAVPEPPVGQLNRESRSVNQKPAKRAAIKNSQGKRKNSKLGKGGETRHVILEYLARHPGQKTADISSGTGIPRTAVSFHLSQARKQGIIANSGNRRDSRWGMSGGTAGKRELGPERFDDEELLCKLCNSPCATKERLARHMQQVHGKAA